MRLRIYYVYMHDPELDRFTPQKGLSPGPYTIWGVRRALRRLQGMGYECGKDDASVLVCQASPKQYAALMDRREQWLKILDQQRKPIQKDLFT